jgi:hypothetical protein
VFSITRRESLGIDDEILREIRRGVDVVGFINAQITQKSSDMSTDSTTAQDARCGDKWKYVGFRTHEGCI